MTAILVGFFLLFMSNLRTSTEEWTEEMKKNKRLAFKPLKVREGEAHRDDRVQFGARRELLVHDGARLDRDKGGKGDQQHDDSCHHRQGQDEAETGATLAVFHAVPPGWWYEYYYSFFESGKCHLWPPLGPIAGKVTR